MRRQKTLTFQACMAFFIKIHYLSKLVRLFYTTTRRNTRKLISHETGIILAKGRRIFTTSIKNFPTFLSKINVLNIKNQIESTKPKTLYESKNYEKPVALSFHLYVIMFICKRTIQSTFHNIVWLWFSAQIYYILFFAAICAQYYGQSLFRILFKSTSQRVWCMNAPLCVWYIFFLDCTRNRDKH